MSDRYRRGSCGCTWLIGTEDTGCQDGDCRCSEHCHLTCDGCGSGFAPSALRVRVRGDAVSVALSVVMLCDDCGADALAHELDGMSET